MTIDLALYQPDIAHNTGTLIRLGACLGVPVHVIHPTGFPFSRRTLKRGGLDYVDHAAVVEHDSYARFADWLAESGRRLVLLTTKADISAFDARFANDDVIMVGRESAGVPDGVAAAAGLRLRIPMRPGLRSINMALAAAMIVGEALRQNRIFETLT
jgi:tRNA (cytidine/uridine-2'-O-)-methyltransferase